MQTLFQESREAWQFSDGDWMRIYCHSDFGPFREYFERSNVSFGRHHVLADLKLAAGKVYLVFCFGEHFSQVHARVYVIEGTEPH